MAQYPRIEVIRRYRAHGRNQLPVQIPNGHLSKVSCSQQVHKGPGLSDIASNAERNPVIEDGLVIPGPAKAAVLPGMSFSLLSINIRYEVEIWLSAKKALFVTKNIHASRGSALFNTPQKRHHRQNDQNDSQ